MFPMKGMHSIANSLPREEIQGSDNLWKLSIYAHLSLGIYGRVVTVTPLIFWEAAKTKIR